MARLGRQLHPGWMRSSGGRFFRLCFRLCFILFIGGCFGGERVGRAYMENHEAGSAPVISRLTQAHDLRILPVGGRKIWVLAP